MKKSKLRIHGNDRGLMMLARDVRRRWLQYATNRNLPAGLCVKCNKKEGTEIDHKEPVGSRPRTAYEFGEYIERMFTINCQRLCHECHLTKTNDERVKRKGGKK